MATEDSIKRGSARISERVSDRGALLQTYASDPKYKKYAQQVEKCLSSFDSVHEWADFIAFLKQLLKTLQAYMQFKEIPRKIIVAKRLSQCLNPALPSGVHSRALDVYSHIISVVGSEGLKRDLPLWASGLFPFFEYAATSVKPTLLNIYDMYFLPLQAGLRPVMKSFILALLPGLEEETGEFFDKVLGLLDRLSGTVSPSFFLQNIWLVMLTMPSARGTSLNFLSRRLPRLNGDEDITSIVGRDTGLMIRAFAAALEDDNLLVRRGALDLLLQSLRIDNAAVQKASPEDRAILMRAATSVVMRRDLSLNRRLYTWLLGADENSEQQVAYLRANALELLRSTLRDEMFSPSAEYSESRPFKIFISLLDKWGVGGPLTEALIFDTFKALKKCIESSVNNGEDLVMTASTLYEAVEPRIVWRKLFEPLVSEITGDGTHHEAIDLVKFILTKFHVRDEEIQTVHLPIVFAAVMNIVQSQMIDDGSKSSLASISEALQLEEIILQQIPTTALVDLPDIADPKLTSGNLSPYGLACSFYDVPTSLPDSGSHGSPFVTVFSDLAKFSVHCAAALSSPTPHVSHLHGLLLQCLVLLNKLVEGLSGDDRTKIQVDWSPAVWLSTMLTMLDEKGRTFTLVNRIVTLVISLQRAHQIEPCVSVQDRSVAFKIVQTLFSYLRPEYTVYHVRAMHLIWDLEHVLKRPHIESVIAQSLTSPESRNVQERYEAFGVFWRLTEDEQLPGFRFRIPMMMVLDTLKNDDPNLRRIGETWMRCSLKSYLRILDPILYDLLEPTMRRVPSVTNLDGKEILDFSYERPFDQSYVNYLLETLLSVVRFGGQGFSKTIRSNEIRRSPHPGMLERLEASGIAQLDATYQDVLVDLLTRFLQSECKHKRVETMVPFNIVIQSTAIELLQTVIARGDIDSLALEGVEAAVIGKLYLCVHKERLELQNKLLHLLHSIISTTTTYDPRQSTASKPSISDGLPERPMSRDGSQESGSPNYAINPLLVQTLLDGIGTPSNRSVLQHWLDFIMMTIPLFRNHVQTLLPSLSDCVGRQLQHGLADIRKASSQYLLDRDLHASTTDAELVMLLNALERLILLSLSSPYTGPGEDDGITAEKPIGTESSGLFGIMNVFSSEVVQQPAAEEQLTARSPAYRSLHEGVRVLFNVWASMAWSEPETWSARDESLSLIHTKTRARCRRVFEHLFRVQSAEVLELIIECWSREHSESSPHAAAAFELVDTLTSSAQNVVHMVCESISCRLPSLSDKGRRQVVNPNLTDGTLFLFMEQYMRQLEGPLVIQVWGRFLQLAKEVLSNTRDFKGQVFPVLRCITVLADKMTQTTAMEDRRIRKDLQDTYGKLLDLVVVSVSRGSEASSWIRRTTKDSLVVNGRDSPLPRVVSEGRLDEKLAASNASLQDLQASKQSSLNDQAEQVTLFVLQNVLPNLRRFLMDNDKVTLACTNIVYYIVNPSLKAKSRPLDMDDITFGILRELSSIPPALKAWRAIVAEILNDNRFFNSLPEAGEQFRPITKAFIDADKTAFPELLGKVTTAPSTNIFTNREYENLLRSLNLRRLSYVLACGEKNQFLTSLPTIQEKLVEVLKNVTAPVVQAEVYLCVRVLLCRLSPHNLVSFWPVILTEMYRLLDSVMANLPADGSEDLPLILAACKCLDLLLVLQTEEFQVHQWIFITDTVDAVYRPDNILPEAIFDQLAEIAGRLPVSQSNQSPSGASLRFPPAVTPSAPDHRPMRRPILNGLRQIDSIRDLVPFFSSVSIASYESVYASGGNIAWDEVEQGIAMDMFEGR